jgi:tryptophan-rich sensory protein
MRSPVQQIVVLVAFIVLCLAVGGVGSYATLPEIPTWYATLAKPSFNPPNWIFGPVWTTLYILMALAAWLVWRTAGWPGAAGALGLFLFQLALNLAWSFIFFAWHRLGLALVEVLVLLAAIVATALAFRRHSRLAALLLIPYICWVTFASLLNAMIWRLN